MQWRLAVLIICQSNVHLIQKVNNRTVVLKKIKLFNTDQNNGYYRLLYPMHFENLLVAGTSNHNCFYEHLKF